MTRAFKKLTDLKNAVSMAILLLANIDAEECYGNIFSENFDKNHCKNCRNGIHNFLTMPNLKQFLQKFYVGPICATMYKSTAAEEILIKNDADPETARSSTNLIKNDVDLVNISAIKEELMASLLSIASRLLKSEHTRLHHLSEAEQQLWNSFEKADIYEFLTGEKDTIQEFQFNWISPEAPAICQVPSTVQAQPPAAPPPVQPASPPAAPPLPAQPAAPPVVQPAPVVHTTCACSISATACARSSHHRSSTSTRSSTSCSNQTSHSELGQTAATKEEHRLPQIKHRH
jgi:hypothetical protein